MNIAYVGTVLNESEISLFEAASVAGNKMQLGILKGLYLNNNDIEVFSSLPHKSFNGKGKVFVGGRLSYLSKLIKVKYISYINIVLFKQITLFFGYFFELLKYCARNRGDSILMVYNTVSFMGLPVLIAAKLFNCKAVSIIADLPIKCSNFNILHRIEGRTEILLIKYFDGIIPITRQIQEDFAPTKPFIVIEGGHESQICSSAIKPISLDLNVKKVIFSGALNNLSGIELLLEAFSKISRPEYQLHIYGSGEKAFIVEDYVRKDSRIQYHGFIDNARIIEKQERADLLVSPRLPDNYITKYTFPSKVLEYIFSGIPVLSNDLPGLPDEYADFINIAPTHDSDEWAKQIVEITEDKSGTFRQKAIKARLAAEAKKSWSFQASQINEFLKGLLTKLD